MFASDVSCQLTPFQSSVSALGPCDPQTANADVYIPAPPRTDLPLFKLLTSVQVEPSQSSVSPICGAAGTDGEPPKTTAFDAVPAPATYILTAFKSVVVLQEPAADTVGN